MTEVRKIIRVFLASPGDLSNERIAVSEVVAEINDNWADFLGYQIELMGWEDTVSRHRRPQAIINQDLDRCELFIGMMWKKWGTPPDAEGRYTSGFEEEYDRAIRRREESGVPEISMFFKKISENFLEDKGPDLLKVLEFRQELIDGKKQLFQQFSAPSDLTSIVRKCITQYLVDIKKRDELEETARGLDQQSGHPTRENDEQEVTSPFSAEGFQFLSDFVGKVQDKEEFAKVSACEIARFRLLSCSIWRSGNDDRYIGVHDQNILYANKDTLALGPLEVTNLVRSGFRQLSNENTPLWHWYEQGNGEFYAQHYSAFGDSDAEKQGAIQTLDWLSATLPADGTINKKLIVARWFNKGSSSNLRNTAIKYLSNHGDSEDIAHLRNEYDRNENQTSRVALEGLIKLSARVEGDKSAARLAISKQFDVISADVLSVATPGFGELDTEEFKPALSHRNAEMRLNAMRELDLRGELTVEEIGALLEDDNAEIRYEALLLSIERGGDVDDDAAKKILVRPRARSGFNVLSWAAQTDEEGEKYYEIFTMSRLRAEGPAALQKRVDVALFHDDSAYFALAEKYFAKWGDDLRKNIDDKFVAYFEERVRRFEKLDPKREHSKTVERVRGIELSLRKQLVRQGVDIICRKGQKKDLQRIRGVIESDFVGGSTAEFEYMSKYGHWRDIESLADLKPEFMVQSALAIWGDPKFDMTKAKTIYKLGRKDPNRLLRMKISSRVRNMILVAFSEATFAKIKDDLLFELLNDESDQIRKSAATLAVRALTHRKLKSLLETYVLSDAYRYYNVIHWLDLGVSMPRGISKTIAKQALH